MPAWRRWGWKASHDRIVARVLCCFNEWLRRIAPARGDGRACHGTKSLPQYLQTARRWYRRCAVACARGGAMVRGWPGLPFKTKSCVLASPLPRRPSLPHLERAFLRRVASASPRRMHCHLRLPSRSHSVVTCAGLGIRTSEEIAKAASHLWSRNLIPATTLDQRPTATTLPTNNLAH